MLLKKRLMILVDKACSEYEDGETGVETCVELYCEGHGIPDEVSRCAIEYYMYYEARIAGIPHSVIMGKTQLSDHFSEEYINEQCGIKNEEIPV